MARMRKGSPEAKAWGRKMQRLRGSKGSKRSRRSRASFPTRTRKKRVDNSRGIKVVPDIIEAGGIVLGASEVKNGNTTGGLEDAGIGIVAGEALKYAGKKSKLLRKLHKVHKVLGIKVRIL